MYREWSEGIFEDYRELGVRAAAEDEIKFHSHAAALNSSQAFALNLFVPFREGGRAELSARFSELVGEPLSVEEVRFEWVPPGALLGELAGDRPASKRETATGVDVVLWCRLSDGAPGVVLIEVKLSEGGFTHCGGLVSPAILSFTSCSLRAVRRFASLDLPC